MLAIAVLTGPAAARAATGETTAQWANPARTGAVTGAGVGDHPARAWELDAAAWGDPLVADGRIFVLRWDSADSNPALVALDARTGSPVWTQDVAGTQHTPAYDAGTLFLQGTDGTVEALSAYDGHQLWSTQLQGQQDFFQPPIARDGHLFSIGASVGTTIYSVDEASGHLEWSHFLDDGGDGPLSTDGTRVYSTIGPRTYAFNVADGSQAWYWGGPETGGGGNVAPIEAGRVYTQDWGADQPGRVIDAAGGQTVGSYSADQPPALAGGTAVLQNGGTLEAEDTASSRVLWTKQFKQDTVSPILADGVVWTCSIDDLVGLSLANGETLFDEPQRPEADYPCLLGAGDGTLAVSWEGHLTAYRGAGANASPTPQQPASTTSGGRARARLRIVTPRSIRLAALRRPGLLVKVAGVKRGWRISARLTAHRRLAGVQSKARGPRWKARLHARVRLRTPRPLAAVLRVTARAHGGRRLTASRRVILRPR
jgi:hypothetical protein